MHADVAQWQSCVKLLRNSADHLACLFGIEQLLALPVLPWTSFDTCEEVACTSLEDFSPAMHAAVSNMTRHILQHCLATM